MGSKIYEFDLKNVQEAQDWINEKGEKGYKIINIHYYDSFVRYTLERSVEKKTFHSNR